MAKNLWQKSHAGIVTPGERRNASEEAKLAGKARRRRERRQEAMELRRIIEGKDDPLYE